MSILSQIADTDHALGTLDDWLRSLDYTRASREGIRDHVREHGTLEGTVPHHLDLEHYQTATEVFVESLPAVIHASPEWSDEPFAGHWTPSDANRIEPTEPGDDIDVPDAPDFAITRRPGYAESLAADGITLIPIGGGAPDDGPFEPTEANRREYAGWSAGLDDDGMSFPAAEYSLADRKRWQHQNNLTERSFDAPAE